MHVPEVQDGFVHLKSLRHTGDLEVCPACRIVGGKDVHLNPIIVGTDYFVIFLDHLGTTFQEEQRIPFKRLTQARFPAPDHIRGTVGVNLRGGCYVIWKGTA